MGDLGGVFIQNFCLSIRGIQGGESFIQIFFFNKRGN